MIFGASVAVLNFGAAVTLSNAVGFNAAAVVDAAVAAVAVVAAAFVDMRLQRRLSIRQTKNCTFVRSGPGKKTRHAKLFGQKKKRIKIGSKNTKRKLKIKNTKQKMKERLIKNSILNRKKLIRQYFVLATVCQLNLIYPILT